MFPVSICPRGSPNPGARSSGRHSGGAGPVHLGWLRSGTAGAGNAGSGTAVESHRGGGTLGSGLLGGGLLGSSLLGGGLLGGGTLGGSLLSSGAFGGSLLASLSGGGALSRSQLVRALVRRGESVQRGQLLADSGNTGRSTGPHLHWIVKIAGKAVDPARFAPATPAS